MRLPTFFVSCAVGISIIHGGFIACSAPQTHQSIELGAYAAEKALCDTEAQSYDAGETCLTKVTQEYASFWAVDGGAHD